MVTVKIYSTPGCPHCVHAKEFFKEQSIEFEDSNVAENPKAAEEMIEKSGQRGVPVIFIDDQMVIGFDQEKIEELLKK